MKNKQIVMLGMAAISLNLLVGCQYFDSKLPKNPPSQREQLCSNLKRNLVFNTTSMTNQATASPTQRAETMRLYEKNNCRDFEK